tara:strand:- start:3406 stop:3900 length:495 start_codon:yes stop_codon:yes gene_type:complete
VLLNIAGTGAEALIVGFTLAAAAIETNGQIWICGSTSGIVRTATCTGPIDTDAPLIALRVTLTGCDFNALALLITRQLTRTIALSRPCICGIRVSDAFVGYTFVDAFIGCDTAAHATSPAGAAIGSIASTTECKRQGNGQKPTAVRELFKICHLSFPSTEACWF